MVKVFSKNRVKDTMKAFKDFKNKQKIVRSNLFDM